MYLVWICTIFISLSSLCLSQSQVAFLQGERKGQENMKQDLVRRIKMLEYALKQERWAEAQMSFFSSTYCRMWNHSSVKIKWNITTMKKRIDWNGIYSVFSFVTFLFQLFCFVLLFCGFVVTFPVYLVLFLLCSLYIFFTFYFELFFFCSFFVLVLFCCLFFCFVISMLLLCFIFLLFCVVFVCFVLFGVLLFYLFLSFFVVSAFLFCFCFFCSFCKFCCGSFFSIYIFF